MDVLIRNIAQILREEETISSTRLAALIRLRNRGVHEVASHCSKKKILQFYLKEREAKTELWSAWDIDEQLHLRIMRTLQMKPRRTASGVATISVITKPAPCASSCLYCPNDVRMPKSYLSDEPACQRAERNYFDPYLQVASRLRALESMGHSVDKIELIILGGSWSDYERDYQLWFVRELFSALNDSPQLRKEKVKSRKAWYEELGIKSEASELFAFCAPTQDLVNRAILSYNEAIGILYGKQSAWHKVTQSQKALQSEVELEHKKNENATHRVVGLVMETRPDSITAENLYFMRFLGCTKVQIGIQSLSWAILQANERKCGPDDISNAFSLLRLFGFKIHVHFMLNLYGATPHSDRKDYQKLISNPAYLPDEVKLYPCVLVEGTGLCKAYKQGAWEPYSVDTLIELLASDVLATPSFTRISRMIRDISAHDIKAGNKETNLRQRVEKLLARSGKTVREIRLREINTLEPDTENLSLDLLRYRTTVSEECFLQWLTPDGHLAGFLRLSLPNEQVIEENKKNIPVKKGEAMIREVHVYGRAARLHDRAEASQHHGLGRKLIASALEIARNAGYEKVNVISSVGTRTYYRNLGFKDMGLYQQISVR